MPVIVTPTFNTEGVTGDQITTKMDTIIIGIYVKHHQHFTQNEITAKEESTKQVTLILGILSKIWTMISCSNIRESDMLIVVMKEGNACGAKEHALLRMGLKKIFQSQNWVEMVTELSLLSRNRVLLVSSSGEPDKVHSRYGRFYEGGQRYMVCA